MNGSHKFALGSITPQNICTGGSRADATAHNFPALTHMSLSLLTLFSKGLREPHWHPNANELSYCLEGEGLMTIFGPHNTHDSFTLSKGSIAFVPKGSLHAIENRGEGSLRMLVCFDNATPEDLEISSSISAMPAHILAETFQQKSSFFEQLQGDLKPVFISQLTASTPISKAYETNRYKMELEAISPQLSAKGGWVKMSNAFLFPALEGLAIYSLYLNEKGAREPHWHPNAAELNYLISGDARISLLSPHGKVESFDMHTGDMSYLPQGYLHHIENLGEKPAQYAIFFNHCEPNDIGISGCLGAFSNKTLSSLFKKDPAYFKDLPKYQQDLFIISGAG